MNKATGVAQEPSNSGSGLNRGQMTGADFRWTAKRKALLLSAVDEGLLTEALVAIIYGISKEELLGWRTRMAAGGLKALRLKSAGGSA